MKLVVSKLKIKKNTMDDFLGPSAEDMPRLSEEEARSMSGKLAVTELTQYLKKSRNNVSPGSS